MPSPCPPWWTSCGRWLIRIGLRDRAAEHLDLAVEAVCRNVVEHAFDPDEAGQNDIEQRS